MTNEADTSPAQASPDAQEQEQVPTDAPDVEGYAEQAKNYRIQRNKALRQAHAFKTMLEMHGISTKGVTDKALEALPIHDGAVDGKYDYTPPKIAVPPPQRQRAQGGKPTATLESASQWTGEDMVKRWDELSPLIANELPKMHRN